MSVVFELTAEAVQDLDTIWWYIAADSVDAANRVESAILETCRHLAQFPMLGVLRPDVTRLPVRFRTVARFRNHLIVYRPDAVPVQVIRILHGKRNLKTALKQIS